jgi:hypothetical protein
MKCLETASLYARGCGVVSAARATSIELRVIRYLISISPEISSKPEAGSFAASGWRDAVTVRGETLNVISRGMSENAGEEHGDLPPLSHPFLAGINRCFKAP